MSKSKRGFTLIELMIVVAIIGILAAIALPAFTSYIRRAKTSEAANNLKALFTGAASYYMREGTGQGVNSTAGGTACMAEDGTSSNTPGVNKTTVATWNDGFVALNFGPADPIYYQYQTFNGNGSTASACGVTAGDTTVYSFRARGNLDGDTITATFELSVGSNADNELYRAPGFYVTAELE